MNLNVGTIRVIGVQALSQGKKNLKLFFGFNNKLLERKNG